ncbi:sensor histidine kinase [Paenibacillus hamazuiensis]|uniref:sensor histidine kinase n=1 Tax=Paenibacillus hamazuiensis TaxID=2936508 RepID=UPI00200FB0A6|nr:sensor histidine kinase [Paenibacillus hamazuiensis]
MRKFYLNLSVKYKIFILFYLLVVALSLTLGYYSYQTSSNQIIEKVSMTNTGVIKEIENNITGMQRNISDWVTVFSLASEVQAALIGDGRTSDRLESSLYSGPTASMMNQMLFTRNFDYLALYGKGASPIFQEATDGSSGAVGLPQIESSRLYEAAARLNGASYWFPLTGSNSMLIQNNRNEKIGMARIVRSIQDGSTIGFIFMGINHETIRQLYLKNLYDDQHSIIILDENGIPLLQAGREIDVAGASDPALATILKQKDPGSAVASIGKQQMLISYSGINENGWRILYVVPLALLTQELSSIKVFVIAMILACLLLSVPLMMILTSILTAPLKTLLASMKRFQNGHFDERVEIKYRDEIGELSRGYNSMVKNIKDLVNDVYVLQLREKEAELKALQSQINPHFLYNTLDTIFWEAEAAGQSRISEMIVNLSRLFRLSLNRGKSFTNVGKEKEMLGLYLSLQKMRFKDLLQYRIDIPDEMGGFVMMKLVLQPFVENALVHGIERKRGGGSVTVTGALEGNSLHFVIEDTGAGMDEMAVKRILEPETDGDINTSRETGGYAIRNVNARLRHYYKDNYEIRYDSKPGQGTRVELTLPAIPDTQEG